MGQLSKLHQFERKENRSTATIDGGGGYAQTADHFSDPGDDSHPLPGDYLNAERTQRTGIRIAVGYIDPKCSMKALPGDKRIYSRDEETGEEVAEVWLKNTGDITIVNQKCSFTVSHDGSINGVNENGSFSLQAGGSFSVNGVVIDSNGKITCPGTIEAQSVDAKLSLKVLDKEVNLHAHTSTTPGSPTSPF